MKSRALTAVFGSLLLALSSSCASTRAPAPTTTPPRVAVQSFGTMHATMTGGVENAVSRVTLDEVQGKPGAFALGTAVGLDGEITVYDGRALISRTRTPSFETTTDPAGEGAAWLTVAHVTAWTEVPIPSDLDQAAFEAFLGEAAAKAGLDVTAPLPFAVRGPVAGLRAHVLRGACPMRPGAQLTAEQAPYVFESVDGVEAHLVGFRATDAVGKLTHPGTTVHLHAILEVDGKPLTAHVERFSVRAGSTLRLPALR